MLPLKYRRAYVEGKLQQRPFLTQSKVKKGKKTREYRAHQCLSFAHQVGTIYTLKVIFSLCIVKKKDENIF
jgi:hypothetical protein